MYHTFFFLLPVFWDTLLLCNQRWPESHDPPASGLGLQACNVLPYLYLPYLARKVSLFCFTNTGFSMLVESPVLLLN
jgi:hypothetical protein